MIENISNDLITLIAVLLGLCITVVSFFLSKKVGTIIEIMLLLVFSTLIFMVFPIWEAVMLVSYMMVSYGVFGTKIDRENRSKQEELRSKIIQTLFIEMIQTRDYKRIIVDVGLTVFVVSGALSFYIFAPEHFTVLKYFIVVMLIGVLAELIERIGNFYSTRIYWIPEQNRLFIISKFQSREIPINDLKQVQVESSPDLLKLHPLFTFLSANQDYTNSFQTVLKLTFPGENIFITPIEIEKWQGIFNKHITAETEVEIVNVLPFWHPSVWKRLFWKGYYAVALKGISAYTGLLLILIWLQVPTIGMIAFILFWWLLNLYVSDRVLVMATDAAEIMEGKLFDRAQLLFQKAEIPNVKLFVVDSPIHNGLATGMNIGRGTILMTNATLQLSIDAVEAIIAHEAIHIKKRDVLMTQLSRIVFFGVIASLVYLFYDYIVAYADNYFVIFPFFFCLMIAFPIYLSIIAQLAEVRADHLAAELLTGGRQQMKNGLSELGNALDYSLTKAAEYSTVDNENDKKIQTRNLERNSWLFRFIEFQFQEHPPLYWRIHMLTTPLSYRKARRLWFIGRLKESLPDFGKVRTK